MITAKNRARKLRLLTLLTLCLLLAGLAVACSDLGDSVAAPTEEVTQEIVEGPVENSLTDTDRSGGFYADTDNPDASMNTYLKEIYQEIRYPATARSSGTSGKFRAKLVLGTNGEIETINISEFTDKLAGGPPAFPEVVIVGDAPNNLAGAETPEVLTKEIDRVLNAMKKFQPMTKGGKPTRQSLNIDFTFKFRK
jgi:outer membrane biosynthesis protein TonB